MTLTLTKNEQRFGWLFLLCEFLLVPFAVSIVCMLMGIYSEAAINVICFFLNAALAVLIFRRLLAAAVLLALMEPPIAARTAVIVVPMLEPYRIGIAPASPRILVTPSGPAVAARFWTTAITAEELCTTTVITVPNRTPRTGESCTCSIKSTNTGASAKGFIVSPIILIPTNSIPNPMIVCPKSITISFFFRKKNITNPINRNSHA